MAFNNSKKRAISRTSKAIADAASWCCACVLVSLILLCMFKGIDSQPQNQNLRDNTKILSQPCDEIYVVGEGETLHTISDKCGDPFIVEMNPHIHDPDDVFPGLVIKITPNSQHS